MPARREELRPFVEGGAGVHNFHFLRQAKSTHLGGGGEGLRPGEDLPHHIMNVYMSVIYRYHIMNITPASRRPSCAQTRSLPRRRQLLSVPICPGFLGVIGMITWIIMRRRRMVRMILSLGIQSLSDSVRAQTRKVGSK